MDPQVIIVGPLKLQNELLTFFIGRSTGLRCVRAQEYSFAYINETQHDKMPLVLWDCLGIDGDNLQRHFAGIFKTLTGNCPIAIFNAGTDKSLENEAIKLGIRGMIYENDPPAILIKGIQALYKGELWYPRDILAKKFMETKATPRAKKKAQSLLTPRERQILTMIAAGAANDEIATDLKISTHTVKTHLYNIYNKLRVPNRIQAALWASKNFN
jgi:LuxR family transcriptional regulator of csgAB operon